jgi:hypothetical protein
MKDQDELLGLKNVGIQVKDHDVEAKGRGEIGAFTAAWEAEHSYDIAIEQARREWLPRLVLLDFVRERRGFAWMFWRHRLSPCRKAVSK